MNLRDQVAVISGATGGIGQAIVLALAAAGMRLALVGRNRVKLRELATHSAKSAPAVRYYETELTKENDVQELSEHIFRDFGHADILVHCAGVALFANLEDGKIGDLDFQYQTNVRAPYLLTKVLLESLKKQKGQIVFINSTAGLQPRANLALYAASKHALKALADSLRDEVNPAGIRVLSVFLGRTATPMQAEIFRREQREYHPELLIQPEDVASVVVNALTLSRTAEITEIRMRPLVKSC
jgi:short-subunit dehydrogenase